MILSQAEMNLYAQYPSTTDTITVRNSAKITQNIFVDSIGKANEKNLKTIQENKIIKINKDSILSQTPIIKKSFLPNSSKATWLAVIFPGGGQIYNRKYWKLPIFYGGFVGCAYALSWNNKMYKDYGQAYLDIMDSNPSTDSYLDLIPSTSNYTETQLKTILKKRKDMYRRYRDMSIFAFIGVYFLSIIDAYVDAELSNFDISPDLSMGTNTGNCTNAIQQNNNKVIGVHCVLRF
ncbi:MAG: DUF5683 domain-containing protein [Bacteroidaceae bacterium]